jgi:MHS family alpha-ketoglutarate permease-like MFS transporter
MSHEVGGGQRSPRVSDSSSRQARCDRSRRSSRGDLAAVGTLTYYIWVSYMAPYAHTATGIPLGEAFLANTLAIAVFLCLLPFGGLLSDRIGRKPMLIGFALGFLLLAWPAFHFLRDDFGVLLAIELAGIVLLVGYSANCAVVMAQQFPAEVRTVGIGLPYALAVAIFGGTAPYVTTWLTSNGHQDLIWLYVAAAALVGLVVYATMPETRGKDVAWVEGREVAQIEDRKQAETEARPAA